MQFGPDGLDGRARSKRICCGLGFDSDAPAVRLNEWMIFFDYVFPICQVLFFHIGDMDRRPLNKGILSDIDNIPGLWINVKEKCVEFGVVVGA